jgi:hypothetical protein
MISLRQQAATVSVRQKFREWYLLCHRKKKKRIVTFPCVLRGPQIPVPWLSRPVSFVTWDALLVEPSLLLHRQTTNRSYGVALFLFLLDVVGQLGLAATAPLLLVPDQCGFKGLDDFR